MKTRDRNGIELAAFVVLWLAAFPYLIWADAFVLMHVWDWFKPDAWASLSFKTAVGASFVVGLFKSTEAVGKKRDPDDDGPPEQWGRLIGHIVLPWLCFAIARFGLWVFFQ